MISLHAGVQTLQFRSCVREGGGGGVFREHLSPRTNADLSPMSNTTDPVEVPVALV